MTSSVRADVLVVTALPLERLAVREHLDGLETKAVAGLQVDLGVHQPSGFHVAVIETGAGNVEAAIATVTAEEALRPGVVAMCGVAGGVKDVGVGDVVISSKVAWYESGKQAPPKTVEPFDDPGSGDDAGLGGSPAAAPGRFLFRPEVAPVSYSLVQLARALVADGGWLAAGRGAAGAWSALGREPAALVGPVVAGEKVLADDVAALVVAVKEQFSDALVVDMEDYGMLRAGAATERVRQLAVRGVSDLLAGKSEADAGNSQLLAAGNAAAFLFTLLGRLAELTPPGLPRDELVALCRALYPQGPLDAELWGRAGGDTSRLDLSESGAARWFRAVVLLENGGGGVGMSQLRLLETILEDFPQNATVRAALGMAE